MNRGAETTMNLPPVLLGRARITVRTCAVCSCCGPLPPAYCAASTRPQDKVISGYKLGFILENERCPLVGRQFLYKVYGNYYNLAI